MKLNWKDITVEKFQELQKTFDFKPTALTQTERDIQIADWRILQMSIIKDETFAQTEQWVTLDDIETMKIFIDGDMPIKVKKRLRLNGNRYEFELDPTLLKGGAYMSLMKNLETPYDNFHKILSNFAHKVDWKGKRIPLKPSEIHKVEEDFKQAPMDRANGLVVFFWNLSKDLTSVSQDFLVSQTKKMKKMTDELAEDLKDGVGL